MTFTKLINSDINACNISLFGRISLLWIGLSSERGIYSVKKIFLLLLTCLIFTQGAFAIGAGYKYPDNGVIYSQFTYPVSVPLSEYAQTDPEVTQPQEIDLKKLKTAKVSNVNVLGLIKVGDAGIYKAAKKAGMNNVYYVDVINQKVYIPILFIPVYFKKTVTTIYGE